MPRCRSRRAARIVRLRTRRAAGVQYRPVSRLPAFERNAQGPDDWFEIFGDARPGDSGGGVFDAAAGWSACSGAPTARWLSACRPGGCTCSLMPPCRQCAGNRFAHRPRRSTRAAHAVAMPRRKRRRRFRRPRWNRNRIFRRSRLCPTLCRTPPTRAAMPC